MRQQKQVPAKWFKECKSLDEGKKLYRKLAMQYHPDRDPQNEDVIKEINLEYEQFCEKDFTGQTYTADDRNNAILEMQEYKEAVNKIINIPGIKIELMGSWLWVTGNTKPLAPILKTTPGRFTWARKKDDFSAWFFRTDEHKAPNRGAKMSIDRIRTRHGSEEIKGQYKPELK